MELREWRRLAIQSVALLAVVLVSCLGFSRQMQGQPDAGVQAEDRRRSAGEHVVARQDKKEVPTAATKALVEERSDTYMKIPKEKITSASGVYLQNNYIDFEVMLTFQGVESGCIHAGDILRVRGYQVNTGKISKDDAVFDKIEVADKGISDSERNEIQIKFTLKRAYEPILFEAEDAYYISLLSARRAHEKIVVIDAGHGGMDEGTMSVNKKHYEKDYVLYIQDKLSKLLDKTDITVYYTRTTDEQVTKKDRVRLANALQADLFVSIHCNALQGGVNTEGVETLYSKRKPKYGNVTNRELAELMLDRVTESTGRKKRAAIVREGLYLMRCSKVPTTIVEVGYMTNQGDMNFMKKEIGQQKIAEGIYQSIIEAMQK